MSREAELRQQNEERSDELLHQKLDRIIELLESIARKPSPNVGAVLREMNPGRYGYR